MAIRQWFHAVRMRIGDLWFYSGMSFVLNRGGDAVNVFIGVFLVPRFIAQDELGALLPLMAVGTFFSAPLGILLLPVEKFLNTFLAWGETGKAKALLQDMLVVVAVFALLLIGWMYWSGDAILVRLQVQDRRLLWPIVGFALIGCVLPKLQAAQNAMKLFKATLLPPLVTPLVRLAGMLILLPALGVLGYLITQLTLQVIALLIVGGAVFFALRRMSSRVSYRAHWGEMARYTLPLVGASLALRVYAPVELFVIRHRLPPIDSAGFYFATMFGAIPNYFTSAVMPYLMPLISDRFERGLPTRKLLVQPMLFTLLIGGSFTVLFIFIMPWVFRIPGPWTAYGAYARFAWQISLMNTLKHLVAIFNTHEAACRRFTYLRYYLLILMTEAAVLYGLPAWSLARPYVPASLWHWINQYAEPDLQRFVTIMIVAHLACAAGCLIHLGLRRFSKIPADLVISKPSVEDE